MALRYYVSTYRSPTCDNKECENHGHIISIDTSYVPQAQIGESWRTLCDCGDGAGWALNKVEWDPLIQIDEVKIDMKIQIHDSEVVDPPIGDGITKPYWQHDCDKCAYLGSRQYDDKYYDFYFCTEMSGDGVGTGIIREGNNGDNNSSYLFRSIMSWQRAEVGTVDICDDLQTMVIKHLENQ